MIIALASIIIALLAIIFLLTKYFKRKIHDLEQEIHYWRHLDITRDDEKEQAFVDNLVKHRRDHEVQTTT